MDEQVYPEVGMGEAEELEADGQIVQIAVPEEDAPIAEEPTEEPTSRRSRAAERGQRQPKPAVNLSDLPEFRAYQSQKDKEIAEERRAREELQAQVEQQRQQATAAQMQAIERAIDDSVDPDEQRRLRRQLADMEAAESYGAWQRWDTHVRRRVSEEGLEQAEFDPRAYQGNTGAMQFERDLAAKKAQVLQAQLASAKAAADPATIAKTIEREVAKALRSAGLDVVDTATPASPSVNTGNAWVRDLALFQSGRMPAQEFKRRWGNRT